MAENRNKDRNGMLLDDDFVRKTYKAGLEQLKASDELIKTTLDRCRAELEDGSKKRKTGFSWNRFALVGTPVAACLLGLVILLNQPMMNSKSAQDMAPSQAPEVAGMAAAGASDGAQAPQARADNSHESENAMEEVPNVTALKKGDVQGLTIMFSEAISPVYGSIDYSHSLTPAAGRRDLPPDAAKAILDAYNQAWGSRYTCDANAVLAISTLKAGGISGENLRQASGFGELLGEQEYHMMPLRDENQAYSLLLPVVESAVSYDDPSAAPFDIVYSHAGRTWLSSMYAAVPADNDQIAFLLDREGHQELVRVTFGVEQITDYRIIDINYGYDFMILIKADDKEYAIPHMTVRTAKSLENHKAYLASDALKGLADSLETQ